jgi:DNA polymerase-3 subunit alpha
MADDGEQPMEMYARYKANPNAWEQDMIDYGLNDKERAIMHKHLDKDFGVCSSQEGMMLMTMDEEIARFNVKESNTIRKGVAKKKPKILQQCKELLYEKGLANGCRQVFLDYVWDVQIAMQRG